MVITPRESVFWDLVMNMGLPIIQTLPRDLQGKDGHTIKAEFWVKNSPNPLNNTLSCHSSWLPTRTSC